MSLEEAYGLQREVTAICSPASAGGIKAGVTSPQAQAYFELDHALIGNLYADGRRASGCAIPHLEGRIIECEAAVFVDAQGAPQKIAPAIELVFLKFGQQSDMTVPNMVACNLGADLYIVGEPRPWSPSYGDVDITLRHDGVVKHQARLSDALDGPEAAAKWMCQEAQLRQLPVTNDTLLMAGACGAPLQASVGHYVADFGALGGVEFELV